MEINTKYNFGDYVYPIISKPEEIKVYNNCPVCHDIGKIELNNTKYTCPECRGNTYKIKYGDPEWFVYSHGGGFIGKIDLDLYDKKYEDNYYGHKSKISYMLDTTGIGSGNLWEEDNLFLSKEEAQVECDRRNKEIRNKTV